MDIVCEGVMYVARLSDGVVGAAVGAVLGSGLTLLGTWRQNLNAREQFKQQLDHETVQAALARKSDTRREVYLRGGEWFAGIQMTMANYPNVQMENPSPEGNWSAVPVQMLMVATEPTVRCINAVMFAYQTFLQRFAVRRQELRRRHLRIMEIPGIMKTIETGAISDEQFEELDKEYDGIALVQAPEMRQFHAEVIDALAQITELATDLQIEVSRELGIEVDREQRLSTMREHNRRSREALEAFLEGMYKRLSDGANPKP
jgi:hypothetical protein